MCFVCKYVLHKLLTTCCLSPFPTRPTPSHDQPLHIHTHNPFTYTPTTHPTPTPTHPTPNPHPHTGVPPPCPVALHPRHALHPTTPRSGPCCCQCPLYPPRNSTYTSHTTTRTCSVTLCIVIYRWEGLWAGVGQSLFVAPGYGRAYLDHCCVYAIPRGYGKARGHRGHRGHIIPWSWCYQCHHAACMAGQHHGQHHDGQRTPQNNIHH